VEGIETMPPSAKLVGLVERNADQLARRWMEVVRKHPGTPTYHDYDESKLHQRAFSVYSQFGKWLSAATTTEEIEKIYTALGAQRREEGFALSELLQALIITRRVLWIKIESEGLLDTALDLNLALQLSNQTILFFDRAMIFAAKGYEA
jgi:hypothetical protein